MKFALMALALLGLMINLPSITKAEWSTALVQSVDPILNFYLPRTNGEKLEYFFNDGALEYAVLDEDGWRYETIAQPISDNFGIHTISGDRDEQGYNWLLIEENEPPRTTKLYYTLLFQTADGWCTESLGEFNNNFHARRIISGPKVYNGYASFLLALDSSTTALVRRSPAGDYAELKRFNLAQDYYRYDFTVSADGSYHIVFTADENFFHYFTNSSGVWTETEVPTPEGYHLAIPFARIYCARDGSIHVFYVNDWFTHFQLSDAGWTDDTIGGGRDAFMVSDVQEVADGAMYVVVRYDDGYGRFKTMLYYGTPGDWQSEQIKVMQNPALHLADESETCELFGWTYYDAGTYGGKVWTIERGGPINQNWQWEAILTRSLLDFKWPLLEDEDGNLHTLAVDNSSPQHCFFSGGGWSWEPLPGLIDVRADVPSCFAVSQHGRIGVVGYQDSICRLMEKTPSGWTLELVPGAPPAPGNYHSRIGLHLWYLDEEPSLVYAWDDTEITTANEIYRKEGGWLEAAIYSTRYPMLRSAWAMDRNTRHLVIQVDALGGNVRTFKNDDRQHEWSESTSRSISDYFVQIHAIESSNDGLFILYQKSSELICDSRYSTVTIDTFQRSLLSCGYSDSIGPWVLRTDKHGNLILSWFDKEPNRWWNQPLADSPLEISNDTYLCSTVTEEGSINVLVQTGASVSHLRLEPPAPPSVELLSSHIIVDLAEDRSFEVQCRVTCDDQPRLVRLYVAAWDETEPGSFYFWPSWVVFPDQVDSARFWLNANQTLSLTIVQSEFPEGFPPGKTFRFFAAALDETTGEQLGEPASLFITTDESS